ncbi:MAG: lipopolysaccharide assembly protein LapB [Rhodanobacteraceae bacterium]
MSPLYLLIPLLPLAAWSGWYLARRGRLSDGDRVNELSSSYFRGLNYLLNEQPDKAIEVFLELAELNRDTVETHLALGNLFRRRGEVERAIRVHQHLVARPNLNDPMKTIALLELGEDYMRAGLLDRAETLFSDLVAMGAHAPSALRHLIAIYQHERDWHKAIEHARKLESMSGEPEAETIAHYYCELAEQSRQHGAINETRDYMKHAFASHPDSVRAHLLDGHLLVAEDRLAEAALAYERACNCDVEFVPEILPYLLETYAGLGQDERAEAFLRELLDRYQGISPVLALHRLIKRRDGEDAAVAFLTAQLRQRPSVRGLTTLIEATASRAGAAERNNFLILRDLTHKLMEGQAMYRCSRCGFGAKAHHWQCPSCKSWGSVRPIRGVANE